MSGDEQIGDGLHQSDGQFAARDLRFAEQVDALSRDPAERNCACGATGIDSQEQFSVLQFPSPSLVRAAASIFKSEVIGSRLATNIGIGRTLWIAGSGQQPGRPNW